jgi:peptidoglycan hydrolase-like protein with peptidoglycan-binding domain
MDMSNFRDRNEIAFDDIAIIRLAERMAPLRPAERLVQLRPADRTALFRELQRRLREEGFYPGPVDGVFGPGTRTALSQYQARHGLPRTGALDDATGRALGVL